MEQNILSLWCLLWCPSVLKTSQDLVIEVAVASNKTATGRYSYLPPPRTLKCQQAWAFDMDIIVSSWKNVETRYCSFVTYRFFRQSECLLNISYLLVSNFWRPDIDFASSQGETAYRFLMSCPPEFLMSFCDFWIIVDNIIHKIILCIDIDIICLPTRLLCM